MNFVPGLVLFLLHLLVMVLQGVGAFYALDALVGSGTVFLALLAVALVLQPVPLVAALVGAYGLHLHGGVEMWAGMLLLMSTSVGIFAWTGDVLIGRASLGVLQQWLDKPQEIELADNGEVVRPAAHKGGLALAWFLTFLCVVISGLGLDPSRNDVMTQWVRYFQHDGLGQVAVTPVTPATAATRATPAGPAAGADAPAYASNADRMAAAIASAGMPTDGNDVAAPEPPPAVVVRSVPAEGAAQQAAAPRRFDIELEDIIPGIQYQPGDALDQAGRRWVAQILGDSMIMHSTRFLTIERQRLWLRQEWLHGLGSQSSALLQKQLYLYIALLKAVDEDVCDRMVLAGERDVAQGILASGDLLRRQPPETIALWFEIQKARMGVGGNTTFGNSTTRSTYETLVRRLAAREGEASGGPLEQVALAPALLDPAVRCDAGRRFYQAILRAPGRERFELMRPDYAVVPNRLEK